MEKNKLIILGLIVLVILLIGYITMDKYSQNKFLEGFQIGSDEAIFQIAKQSLSCQIIPLVINNQTVRLINVDCLNQ